MLRDPAAKRYAQAAFELARDHDALVRRRDVEDVRDTRAQTAFSVIRPDA